MSGANAESRDLRNLLDEAAIRRVLVQYCRGVDRVDLDLIRSVYHPDAIDEHSRNFSGLGVEFPEVIARTHSERGGGQHHLTNSTIVVDGDQAQAETYFLSVSLIDDEVVFVLGRYLDRFERRQAQWKIAHRKVIHDLNTRIPHESKLDLSHFLFHGARSRHDPSYDHFDQA